jgi:hypothetical protein
MNQQSFPFPQHCFLRFQKDGKSYAPVEAEEAISSAEVYQALNGRSRLQFTRPLVLHFENPLIQTPVWFGFSFDVEVMVVGLDGLVKKTYPVAKHKEGSARFIQFFCDYAYAVVVPAGFCKNWGIEEQGTTVKRIGSVTALRQQKIG